MESRKGAYTIQLSDEISTYLRDAGVTQTAFGRAAVGDGAFVGRFLAGKLSPTLATADRVSRYIAQARAGAPNQTRRKEAS